MDYSEQNIALKNKIEELEHQLFESNSIIEAIREGSIDALVLNTNGKAHVYSIESADYTYRILIEKFGEGALSIADTGLILYCNDYFSKLLGIAANQIVGTYFQDYVDEDPEFRLLKKALSDGQSKGEVTLTGAVTKIPVYVSLTDLHPNVAAVGVVVTDLSEKRRNEQVQLNQQRQLEAKVNELHETNTNLEQFIHVISHDLKEPVRKMAMYSQNLHANKSHLFSESELNTLNIIYASALRMNSLVDDLVKYAFIATKVEGSKVLLDDVIKDVLEDLELFIRENNASVVVSPLPAIRGSRVQMRQVFANLIVNAIKYAKADVPAKISITTEIVSRSDGQNNGDFHVIRISDNGIGMDPAHLNKIFTIFQRLHLRDEYSGNGIGLAICKKIMENHSGWIDVESSAEGSIFILNFPVKEI